VAGRWAKQTVVRIAQHRFNAGKVVRLRFLQKSDDESSPAESERSKSWASGRSMSAAAADSDTLNTAGHTRGTEDAAKRMISMHFRWEQDYFHYDELPSDSSTRLLNDEVWLTNGGFGWDENGGTRNQGNVLTFLGPHRKLVASFCRTQPATANSKYRRQLAGAVRRSQRRRVRLQRFRVDAGRTMRTSGNVRCFALRRSKQAFTSGEGEFATWRCSAVSLTREGS